MAADDTGVVLVSVSSTPDICRDYAGPHNAQVASTDHLDSTISVRSKPRMRFPFLQGVFVRTAADVTRENISLPIRLNGLSMAR